MRVKFTHLTGSMRGAAEEFSLPIIKVGRALSSDLLLQDEEGLHRLASRSHAEFRLEGEQFVIYDLGSRNGTFVNGQAVDRATLANGDQVSFGLNGISFQISLLTVPDDEIDFLRTTPLFKDLSAELLHQVYNRGNIDSCPANSLLFRVGEPSTKIYVIRNGIIELRSPKEDNPNAWITNYIGPGDTLGETTALIGEAHSSEARVPEGAEIFSISASRLLELIRTNPDVAEHFVLTFAHYLNRTYKRLFSQTRSKLQGSLFYFDLMTVIQTLINSQESGLLTIYSVGRGLVRSMAWSSSVGAYPLGQIYLEKGSVRYAWVGILTGEEAFYQLFQTELNGSFSFEQGVNMDEQHRQDLITPPSVSLVMEAIRLKDELYRFIDRIPEQTTPFRLVASMLTSKDSKELPLLDRLYRMLLERPVTLIEILDALPCCYARTYGLIEKLLETRQITIHTY